MSELKVFAFKDIVSWVPCYCPSRYLSKCWRGTALDILKHEEIPADDKLWVVCREDVLDAKTLRLFAVWCARQVQYLVEDERSVKALDVAEAFANGEATKDELDAARAAAGEAVWDAACAEAAVRAAVRAAMRAAAWAASERRDFAWRAAAWDAAGEAESEAQVLQLIKMLEGE